MAWCEIWIHIVWSTKGRRKILSPPVRRKLFQHMRNDARSKSIHVDTINGVDDHVHVLTRASATQTASQIVKLLKGESSHWMNKENLVPGGFEWAVKYAAFSVSRWDVPKIREYIRHQEQHHRLGTARKDLEEAGDGEEEEEQLNPSPDPP